MITALPSKDVDALRGAIDAARRSGLPEEDLTEALETLKDATRNALSAAISSGDIGRLRDALQRGAEVLDESELEAARKALQQAEAKAAARKGLQDALKSLEAAEALSLFEADEADQFLIEAVKKKALEIAEQERNAPLLLGGRDGSLSCLSHTSWCQDESSLA